MEFSHYNEYGVFNGICMCTRNWILKMLRIIYLLMTISKMFKEFSPSRILCESHRNHVRATIGSFLFIKYKNEPIRKISSYKIASK